MLTDAERDAIVDAVLADASRHDVDDIDLGELEDFAFWRASYRWWRDKRVVLLIVVVALVLMCCPGLEIANQLHMWFGI